jgi:hypothetical protein
MIRAALIVLLAAQGCDFNRGKTKSSHEDPSPQERFVSMNLPKCDPVDFDIVGSWNVFNYVEEDEPPSSKTRFEANWHLENQNERWRDKHGLGLFELAGKNPEVLIWWRAETAGGTMFFAITEQRFGIMFLTGEDGQKYMAIRTEGGEGLLPRKSVKP